MDGALLTGLCFRTALDSRHKGGQNINNVNMYTSSQGAAADKKDWMRLAVPSAGTVQTYALLLVDKVRHSAVHK